MPEGVNFEAILALQPDLIVAVYSGITQEEYDLLSQIAPTLAQPDGYGDFTIPWQVSTQFIGAALGKSEEAEALIRDVEAQFAAVREQHMEFAGKTFVIANSYDGSYGYFTSEDPRSRFFTELGFVVPDELVEIAGGDFYASISMERIDLLDQDLLVFQSVEEWAGGREGIESDPVLSQMRAMQEGRAVFIPPALDDAFQFQTVLSLPYFLEGIVPELASAVGSDAASAQCEPGFRLFTHELVWTGTPDGVCIPENPQRIAFAWSFHVPALLRAGIPLVGVGDHAYLIHEFPTWQAVIEAIPEIGEPPNPEATLALQPDLIIEPSWAAEENYELVSAIAPTVAFQFDGTHQWKQLAQMYFEIAGRLDAYDTLMAEYEARAQELSALIGNPEDIEISLVAVWGPSRIYTDYSPGGMIVADVGFSRPATQVLQQTPEEVLAAGDYPFFFPLPLEEIQRAEGDFIIAFGDFDSQEGEALRRELEEHPLWQTLEAVRAGNVYFTTVNWAGGDIAGAHAVLDDLARAFGVFDQLSPNPYAIAPETEAIPSH
jgi:ABC-type Fe3+-hydroxamate transport system substrate-binding protein